METTRPTTAITLDTLHAKQNGTLPLKLRVISERKARYYAVSIELRDGTKIDSMTPDILKEAKAEKPKKQFKEISLLFADKEKIANEILNELKEGFTFEAFKNRWSGVKKASDSGNIYFRYAEVIKDFETNGQYGTASNYDLSVKSLKNFIKATTGKEPAKLDFKEITVKWLQRYESYMVSEKVVIIPAEKRKAKRGKLQPKEDLTKTITGLTRTTVGMYLRPLRAIFNIALDLNEIDRSIYPFGKRKYTIPKGNKVNKALTREQLGILKRANATTPGQEEARDYFFLSLWLQGINLKDICLLRNENLEPDRLKFYRAKTMHTSENQKEVKVMLIDEAKPIIEKLRVHDTNPKTFVFPILDPKDSEAKKRLKIQAFTHKINDHLKRLALSVGLTGAISSYFARHSFATLAIQGGESIVWLSKALSHSDIKTTQSYIDSFPDLTNKAKLEGLMNF
ncbi:MAG TPA: site-specific integrase [Paludibacter sp.]